MENDKYIGRLLGGRYELIDVVGVGGMAVVYRARDTILGRYVAIKILKEEFAKDPDIRKRFAIESRAVAKLSHHNIVSVYDVGNEDGTDYIVMELIEGVTLKEYLQQKGRLSWQESIFFAEQISSALVHAHSRGIIHQDIKPQNVIILRDGTAKLTDFGIASFATTQETRVVQEAIGSVHYISPEQAKGSKIDYRTDIYSLGVVMYEMLTGRLPFEGETALQIVMQHINAVPPMPSELVPDIPKGLDAIVMHAMCANISRRYASADELCADLARVREDPDTQFYYTASDDSSGETQVIGREVQRAARHAAAEDTAAIPAAPRRRSEPHSARREAPARRRTSVRERESSDFFEKLSERPAMAAGMAVAVVAAISLLVVAVLMFTGSGKSAKIDVPDLIGRTIDDVYADSEVMNNFEIKEAPSRQESDRPAGEILDQDPGEGQQAARSPRAHGAPRRIRRCRAPPRGTDTAQSARHTRGAPRTDGCARSPCPSRPAHGSRKTHGAHFPAFSDAQAPCGSAARRFHHGTPRCTPARARSASRFARGTVRAGSHPSADGCARRADRGARSAPPSAGSAHGSPRSGARSALPAPRSTSD